MTRQVSTTCSTIADSLGWSWLREPASDGCRDPRCMCHWLINFPLKKIIITERLLSRPQSGHHSCAIPELSPALGAPKS